RKIQPDAVEGFESLAGRGTRGKVDGKEVAVGGPRLLEELKLEPPDDLRKATEPWAKEGRTILHLVVGGKVVAAFGLEDEIRPESNEAVDRLHEMGVRVAMITGDAKSVADSVARRLGIDEVAAEVLPADKAGAVQRFQEGG